MNTNVNNTVESNREIPEGKSITKAEFMDAIKCFIVSDEFVKIVGTDKAMLVGLAVLTSGLKLFEKLFKDTEVIVITKDQLIREIAASAADEDPEFMIIALTNSIFLRKIVDVIFSDDSDND